MDSQVVGRAINSKGSRVFSHFQTRFTHWCVLLVCFLFLECLHAFGTLLQSIEHIEYLILCSCFEPFFLKLTTKQCFDISPKPQLANVDLRGPGGYWNIENVENIENILKSLPSLNMSMWTRGNPEDCWRRGVHGDKFWTSNKYLPPILAASIKDIYKKYFLFTQSGKYPWIAALNFDTTDGLNPGGLPYHNCSNVSSFKIYQTWFSDGINPGG